MLPRNHPDRIQIAFDDHHLVANAGLILPSTLALHLGLPQLVDQHLDLGRALGGANTGDKIMTLHRQWFGVSRPQLPQEGGRGGNPRIGVWGGGYDLLPSSSITSTAPVSRHTVE